MIRLSESQVKYGLICLSVLCLGLTDAQDQLGDLLPANSQLWKSFQDEMKTLEQAAHKVNTLLSERVSQHAKSAVPDDDQQAKPSENIPDVTVLASPDDIKDGVRTKPEESKPEEPEESKPEETKNPIENLPQGGGVRQPLKPHFNLGSFMNSFGFFNNLPEPWWKGKNVCVEKSEKVEEKHKDEKEKELEKHVLIMGTGTFEHCKQTSGKYICTTVISSPEQTKTLSTTYQCCEGFRRQAEGCVEGEGQAPPPASLSTPTPTLMYNPSPNYNKDAVSIVDVGRNIEDGSYSSQSDDARDETLERWRKFRWDRLR